MYGFSDHLKPMPLTGLRALLQGSSRYSIRMSSAGSIEQTFVQLADGIQRLTLPLPTGPKHVHCYLAHGTLFDTGLGLGDAPWDSVDAERIAITHFHPDHVGGAQSAAEATAAPVFQGGLDYAQCERVWGSDDWPERMAAWFVRHGVPADVTEDLIVQGHAFASFIRYAIDPDLLYEGSEVGGWQVLELPGHADGHLGFLRDGVLVGGDHLLRRITPAVGLYPESRPDPLGDYLASLERTIELAPRVVYPGHGEPIDDAPNRARELIEHHRIRLDDHAAALAAEPRTAYEISLDVFGRELTPTQRRFAVAETLSHLERLVREGRAARFGDDNLVSYTSP
ncbi:MAG: MBL fold metallo-hydrolase [Actinobacteria bacterium]|nr:MAG: MBL fold metallo-hydrolase [Actinomycetota bacterium]TML79979.1 MAG: MBL fold metallo-hydrolase [Actinomycetota bacterium]